jgi:hypothetical protein
VLAVCRALPGSVIVACTARPAGLFAARTPSIRRPGKRRLRDARLGSAEDDGLPAVVGAGRRDAGGRPVSTGEQSLRLGDAGRQQGCETDRSAIVGRIKHPIRCSGSDAILVVEPAEHGTTVHGLRRDRPYWRKASASDRCLHPQPAMWPAMVVA